jgi:hypothetical protein
MASVMYAAYQRELKGCGCYLLSGPTLHSRHRSWTSNTLSIMKPGQDNRFCERETIDPGLVTSTELYGYDPITCSYPLLRNVQNYSSIQVRASNLEDGVILADETDLRARRIRVTFLGALLVDAAKSGELHDEIKDMEGHGGRDGAFVVLGVNELPFSGFLIVSASLLLADYEQTGEAIVIERVGATLELAKAEVYLHLDSGSVKEGRIWRLVGIASIA